MIRPVRRTVLALLAALLVAPAAAHASGTALIHDCVIHNGVIKGHYPLKDYQSAIAHIPSDLIEYSSCPSIIHNAELALVAAKKRKTSTSHSSSGGNSGGGGGTTSSGGNGGSGKPSGSSTGSGGGTPTSTGTAQPTGPATPQQVAELAQAMTTPKTPPVKLGARTPTIVGGPSSAAVPGSLVLVLIAVGLAGLGAAVATFGPRVSRRRLS